MGEILWHRQEMLQHDRIDQWTLSGGKGLLRQHGGAARTRTTRTTGGESTRRLLREQVAESEPLIGPSSTGTGQQTGRYQSISPASSSPSSSSREGDGGALGATRDSRDNVPLPISRASPGALVEFPPERLGREADESDDPFRAHRRRRRPALLLRRLVRSGRCHCAMIVLVVSAAAALFLYRLWRAELAIRMPWMPDDGSGDDDDFSRRPLPPPRPELDLRNFSLPLRARGRHVVDRDGRRFKLAAVNWYGASDERFVVGGLDKRHRDDVAATIRRLGFNAVRLPYSDEMVLADPVVEARHLAANPDLVGRTARDVFTAVVGSLTGQGLAVVVNNHITSATWCCGIDPCDAGWSNDHLGPLCRVRQTEEDWIRNWEAVMGPLRDDPFVVGADLRNEVRGLWGTMPWEKWAAAAERCGRRLHRLNRDWLVVVGGTESGNDLSAVGRRPVVLDVPDKVVYSSHVYGWSGWGERAGRYIGRRYGSFAEAMRRNWGYLLEAGTAPVWVGEFGAPRRPTVGDANYWANLVRYLEAQDADFAYWAVNPRKPHADEEETYGLLEDDWETPVLDYRMKDMVGLMAMGLDNDDEPSEL